MKTRAWFALALFLHLLVHPLVHVALVPQAAEQVTVSGLKASPQAARPLDNCALCRTANALANLSASTLNFCQTTADQVLPTLTPDASSETSSIVPVRGPPAA